MSRAFMKDDDGWYHCMRKNDSCMFANDDGSCMVKSCRYGLPDEKDAGNNGPESPQQESAPRS